jgi:hypothetical protein
MFPDGLGCGYFGLLPRPTAQLSAIICASSKLPIAPGKSDRLPAIDLPVANAMNERRQNVQRIAAAF